MKYAIYICHQPNRSIHTCSLTEMKQFKWSMIFRINYIDASFWLCGKNSVVDWFVKRMTFLRLLQKMRRVLNLFSPIELWMIEKYFFVSNCFVTVFHVTLSPWSMIDTKCHFRAIFGLLHDSLWHVQSAEDIGLCYIMMKRTSIAVALDRVRKLWRQRVSLAGKQTCIEE